MADADEDAIPRSNPSNHTDDPSYDPEDETQDFRFLASLAPNNGGGALPKRGEKDFEPNPTRSQASALNASREAMHSALAVERIHPPRNPCIGQYLPHEKDWRKDVPTEIYGPGRRCVVVEKFRGTHNKTVGREDWRNWTWLLPEEALFLLERGSLDVRWPDGDVEIFSKAEEEEESDDAVRHGTGRDDEKSNLLDQQDENGDEDEDEDEDEEAQEDPSDVNGSIARSQKIHASLRIGELPMSLQGAYASLIDKSGLTLERYTVYAGLKRLGYVVHRAPTWDTEEYQPPNHKVSDTEVKSSSLTISNGSTSSTATSLINRITSWLFTSPSPQQYRPSQGPLIRPGLYRNYIDIFRALALIPYTTSSPSSSSSAPQSQLQSPPQPPYQIHFHIWKPSASSTTFKKSHPPPPDFRICVLDARSPNQNQSTIPTLTQISLLLDPQPFDILPKDKRMEMRLKHGSKNVILAIVDCGLVSYLRLADVGSGDNGRVYETKGRRGGKGGGRGRGGRGGRGRGRGGRG